MADIVQAWHRKGKETEAHTGKAKNEAEEKQCLALSQSGTSLVPSFSAPIIPPSRLKDIRKA